MKRCRHCGTTKRLEDFGRNRLAADQRQSWCRECHRIASRERRASKPVQLREVLPAKPADSTNDRSQAVMRSQRKHRERFNAYQREYRARPENQAKMALKRARDAAWTKAKARDGRLNPEELRARAKVVNYYRIKQWHEDNRERSREFGRRHAMMHYARKQGSDGRATPEQVRGRWAFFGGRCWMCGKPAEQTDHVIPLSKGGPDWPSNQRPICTPCNRSKGGRVMKLSEIAVFTSLALTR